jgi:RNA polymerase sigma-70 factor (ECF subfamily)
MVVATVSDPAQPGAGAEASDELLVERCREGSEAAFEALVRRHERALQRHCAPMVGQAAASDATQDAFISAWSAIRSGAEIRALRPWLFTIAHRKALALLRERRRGATEELPESISDGVSSAERVAQTAQIRETLVALAALPEDQREAFLGVAVQGRSGRQIARQLGISELTARQLVFRARASLRAGAAVCLTPPIFVLRWLRRLLAAPARATAAARNGLGWEQAAITAKVAGVAVLGAAAVGTGVLRLSAGSHVPPPPPAARAPQGAAAARTQPVSSSAARALTGRAGAPAAAAGVLQRSAHRGRQFQGSSRRDGSSLSVSSSPTPANSSAVIAPGSADSAIHAGSYTAQVGGGAQTAAVDPRTALRAAATAPAVAATRAAAHAVLAPPLHAAPKVKQVVSRAGHAVHTVVTQTDGTVAGAVSTVGGALTTATAPLKAPTSSLPTVTANVGQAATSAVGGVVGTTTQAVNTGTGDAASAAAQTTAAVTQAAPPVVAKVVVGATGAVSALGKALGAG